ncbi:hypothetical protein BDZ88DRAFT_402879 [Geranomyces variabilis]|nr:hypothetical protein BDZ88DRAFT_402879 [Geranomyces variabilis]KAJ3143063.1 hypothetical protein HDU90_002937 [Geranomyces variabilis]
MGPSRSAAGYSRLPQYFQDSVFSKAPTTRKQFLVRCGVLAAVWNLCYGLALEGRHTPEEMNVLIGKLGVLMLTAELCLSSLLWQFSLHLRQWPRRLALMSIPLNLYLWYLYDHGNILEEHGAFNMLIFFMIGVPVNLVILILYVWQRAAGTWKRFATQFIIFWIIFVTYNYFALRRFAKLLDVGFWGRTGQSACASIAGAADAGHCYREQCVWDKPSPWQDLLPVPQNFFLGPMTCAPIDAFDASIDEKANVLTVTGCPSHQPTYLDSYFNDTRLAEFSGPAVSYLPSTEGWGFIDKEDQLSAPYNNLQLKVLSYVEHNTHAYTSGGLNIGTTQAVLVRCGTHEPKLIFRVSAAPPPAPAAPQPEGELNVVFVFIDAVSRRHFFRKMPKTVATLEQFAARSDATDTRPEQPVLHQFFRYHAIGLNTGPNTRGLWADIPPTDSESGAPPIWEDFYDDGYVTGRMDGVCEDWNGYYNKAHFPDKDKVTIPPRVTQEFLSFSCLPPYLPVGKGFAGNFAGSTSMKAHCLSGNHLGWHMLDWLQAFVARHEEEQRKFFVTGVFLEGHEGSTEVLRTLDDRLARFLDPKINTALNYNNTAVFVQADHGLHMGLNYIFFDNGHVEEVQPFSALLLPKWYTAKYGDNLRHNEDRLITAHDFWATMQGFRGATRAKKSAHGGRDLVREQVGDRDCTELGITEEACRCKVAPR